jgi:DNA-binding transcriptional regulator YhcF (GntR family)
VPIPLPPPQPRPARRAVDRPNLLQDLRKELTSYLLMGQLKPGDRLPSIRALAREKKLDHRIVANAYRSLAKEGLVEIRGRSGVVAAATGAVPNSAAAATEDAETTAERPGAVPTLNFQRRSA